MRQAILRSRHGKGFSYESKDGPIKDKKILDRIASLAIPPAWNNVEIAKSSRAKIQAVGIDSAGRRQYIYNPNFSNKQAAAKFDRIIDFANQLPKLREQLQKDLNRSKYDKRKLLACAITLMDETYFRVGNEKYASENEHYGLTTLRSKHISIEGDKVIFDFIGKSGQHQHKEVSDAQIAHLIKRLDDMPGHELFRYYDENDKLQDLYSEDINEYIKGEQYSAKDFRTWGGTLLATMELAKIVRPETKTARAKSVTICVKKVAKKLGNTPAVTRSSYIDPRILTMFNKSDALSDMYKTIDSMSKQEYLTSDEICALNVLTT